MRTSFKSRLRQAIFGIASASAASFAVVAYAAETLDYRLVPQVGHANHAEAIVIAPGSQWFATAGAGGIVIWDMRSDTVLRELSDSSRIDALAISRDGALVLARTANGKTRAWNAASGEPVTPSPKDVPSGEWTHTEHTADPDASSTKDYIAKIGAEPVISDMHSDINLTVLSTNVKDIVEIDYDSGPDVGVTAAFYDVAKRKLLVRHVASLVGDCGQPRGTFAFDGRHLVLSPTSWDATHFFADAEVIDATAKPPKSVWRHSCQDYNFASIWLEDGLVMSLADPNALIVWDPMSATALGRFNNVNPNVPDDIAVAVSRAHHVVALSTFGPGKRPYDSDKFGVSIARDGKQSFIRTPSAPSEVRLSSDARTVYAKIGDRWQAWDVESTAKVAVGALPAAPPKRDRADARREDEWTRDRLFHRIDIEPFVSGRYSIDRTEVRDASGRVTLTVDARLNLCPDSRHGWSVSRSRGQGIDYWDLASGRLLWTASDAFEMSGKEIGLLVEFADGRVRVSKRAESLVAMVKGFEHRPFDPRLDAAFVEP